MPDRRVRFTDSFFDRLDGLLPDERGGGLMSGSTVVVSLHPIGELRHTPARSLAA